MSEESLENKKDYIKKEIEDKGFDLKDFEAYLAKEKEQEVLDLEKILFMEIQAYVIQYQAKNQDKKIEEQTQPQLEQEPPQHKKKKFLDGSDDEEPEVWLRFIRKKRERIGQCEVFSLPFLFHIAVDFLT